MNRIESVALVASGDSRLAANQLCWPAQAEMERRVEAAFAAEGVSVHRAHPFKPEEGHGFISGQREGIDCFAALDPDMPVVVAEAVWQYSHHVLPGLWSHRRPVLTLANWSGQWPGLVGMLNLNGSLTKAGRPYATLWSESFEDDFFRNGLRQWLSKGRIDHDLSHVRPFNSAELDGDLIAIADRLAGDIRRGKAILGVFDEGCMGMFNAIVPDDLAAKAGFFKERLSQSALYHATMLVPETEALEVYDWLKAKGLTFHYGTDPASELIEEQVLLQCRMYVAAARLADAYGCDAIGIQYQLGLKDLLPASDLAEGMLNNDDRPPVLNGNGQEIRAGRSIIHFNEVDECAGMDAVLIDRVHRALGQPAETTLHDLRWGDWDRSGSVDDYVWVFEISGAAPPAHHIGGWAGSTSMRQPAMYFAKGGGSLRGIARPGEIVWSRLYVEQNELCLDIGLGHVSSLPEAETERRWRATTYEWPIMHAVLHGVSRDQMMARHKANHVQVAYASDKKAAKDALLVRAALAEALGIKVFVCGDIDT